MTQKTTTRVLIIGGNSQDGSLMADLLLSKGYEVYGTIRQYSDKTNIQHLIGKMRFFSMDITDYDAIQEILVVSQPDEIYHFASMNDVRLSYDIPYTTMDVNCGSLLHIFEAVRALNISPKIFYACSSEMYGKALTSPQTQFTSFNPQSPYAVSKAAAFYMCSVYRKAYNMNIYCGILYNHESPRRGEQFLSRKVCKYVVGDKKEKLKLGSIDSRRDWGWAPEYVEYIHNVVTTQEPQDFIIASGVTHSVREFIQTAFEYAGIEDWEQYIEYEESLKRPNEVDELVGICHPKPKIGFQEIVYRMIDHEMKKYGNTSPVNRQISDSQSENL